MQSQGISSSGRIQESIKISDEVLADLEAGTVLLEHIIPKCLRIARLRNDFDAIKWFTLELSGYKQSDILPDISAQDIPQAIIKSGRGYTEKNEQTREEKEFYWPHSVTEIEAIVHSQQEYLKNLRTPESFQPAIEKTSSSNQMFGSSSNERVVETLGSVLSNIERQKNSILTDIKWGKSLLSKIRTHIYNYILNINFQVKFENVTESIFQETKEHVDAQLSVICPDAIKKFVAAYDRLSSDNPEEWSQAMSSCRNVLKEFADHVFPARKEPYKKRNGEDLPVTDKQYKNRLLAFIDINTTGDKNKFLSSRASDLDSRIHSLNDLLSRGTHEGIDITDVRILVLDTYFLIGSLLGLASQVGSAPALPSEPTPG
jgi:hypothetical protein